MTRGLMMSVVLLCSLAASAGAQECEAPERPAPSRPARDPEAEAQRGWIMGGGFTDGRLTFVGAEGKAVAVGPVTSLANTGDALVPRRPLEVIDASAAPPPETVHVARFPGSANGLAGNVYLGYAFSPRLAVLSAGDFMQGEDSEFGTAVVGAVVRYRPHSRVWIEAGPAVGEVTYSYQHGISEPDSITGEGFLAAGGISLLARPKWTLDVQARYAQIWYEGFQGRTVTFGMSVGSVRSGKSAKPESPAAARRDGASR